jgi:hypothetical protein
MPDLDLGDLPPVMTPKQLAALLDKTEDSLANDRYLKQGIPFTRIGTRIYYLRSDLADYLVANRQDCGRAPK